ncbi:MAG: glycosyltransferase family 2 protein [Nitrospinota bacterium]
MLKNSQLVVIPVFNEERTITSVIEKVSLYTKADILVIDDGSTDSSWDKLKKQKRAITLRHPRNMGYGKTLIDGFLYAIEHTYKALVTIDCDEQHEPQKIPEFFNELEEADILSGSRYLFDFSDNNSPPPERKKINLAITEIINRLTKFNLTDSFCGFKAYRVEALKKLNITEPGYGMPLQLWIQAWKETLSIKEKAVARIYKDMTRSFGEDLDNSERRLKYYKSIIKKETELRRHEKQAGPTELIFS